MFHFKILPREEIHLVSFCLPTRPKRDDVPAWQRMRKRSRRIRFCLYSKDKGRCTVLKNIVITNFSVKLSMQPLSRGVSQGPGKLLGVFFPLT